MEESLQRASDAAFSIQTESYSGPLDLLIDLIEKRKFLINDISLASVTDDYMRYIAQFEQSPLREMADFIVLASTLLLLKSKSLLPILELSEAEEETVESLERRLRYYQIFRTEGKLLASLFDVRRAFERPFAVDQIPLFLPDSSVTADTLGIAITNVIANLPKKIEKPKVKVRTVVSLETMIERLLARIEKQFLFKFRDFTGDATERSTVIVSFLAVLEMVKQGSVMAHQSARFNDIEIKREGSSAPRYQ
ncbi:MAG: segregation/condensation protein A [Candidatus Pacebacteria bacterium]|nr:segregation/condensation protein A [Candidatus Paceibacterota bacterium]MCF7857098.1 segregation/condensation protein A [Candidatus Paceibacterota bacterium]